MLFKKIIILVVVFCMGILILGLFLFINLPGMVKYQIQKKLPPFLNPKEVSFDIQKISPFNTFVSKIHIGDGISIDSLDIGYTFSRESFIRPTNATITGLNIMAKLDKNNRLSIQGLPFAESDRIESTQPDSTFLSFLPEKIVMKNCKIILRALDNEFLIPFDVLSFIRIEDQKLLIQAALYPFGEKLQASLTYDLNKGIELIKIDGKSFDLDHINPVIQKKNNKLQLKGAVDFSLASDSPEKEWNIHVSQIGFLKPVEGAVQKIDTMLLIDDSKINASGTLQMVHSMVAENQSHFQDQA